MKFQAASVGVIKNFGKILFLIFLLVSRLLKIKKKPYPFVFVLDLTDFLPEFIDDDLVVEDLKIITYLLRIYLFVYFVLLKHAVSEELVT